MPSLYNSIGLYLHKWRRVEEEIFIWTYANVSLGPSVIFMKL